MDILCCFLLFRLFDKGMRMPAVFLNHGVGQKKGVQDDSRLHPFRYGMIY